MAKNNTNSKSTSRERFERIYHAIRERICLLEYAPGTLLSEDELAQQFGVSRTPLRRVLSRLEAEGLVESQHGVGTFVTDFDVEELSQVYQFRFELASLIGHLSPLPRSSQDLARMKGIAVRGKKLAVAPTLGDFARLNLDYLMELTSMIGNAPLKETVQRHFFLTIRIWSKTLDGGRLQAEARILRSEIEAVLTAMELGDLESVGHLHRTHLSLSFARLRHYVPAEGD